MTSTMPQAQGHTIQECFPMVRTDSHKTIVMTCVALSRKDHMNIPGIGDRTAPLEDLGSHLLTMIRGALTNMILHHLFLIDQSEGDRTMNTPLLLGLLHFMTADTP